MKHSLFNLLGSSLIPELCADIAACTAGYTHLVLVAVATMWALPDKLASALFLYDFDFSVVATYLAIVALCIQLCVHDIVVNILHY